MDQGSIGWVHLSADIVHLLAAGAWIAAILALGTLLLRAHRSMVRGDAEHLHRALARFATVGTLAVALLVVTGLVNSWLLDRTRVVEGKIVSVRLAHVGRPVVKHTKTNIKKHHYL